MSIDPENRGPTASPSTRWQVPSAQPISRSLTGRYRKGSGEYIPDAGKRLFQPGRCTDVITKDGNENYVRIADLVTSAKMATRTLSRSPSVNGENTLRLRVIKEDAGDSVTISARVKERAE